MNSHLSSAIPAVAGIGLREVHHHHVIIEKPDVAWLEVHSENYFSFGSPSYAALEAIRMDYPISLHGVGLSLGAANGLDTEHLNTLHTLVDRIQPGLISEHVAWSHDAARHVPDLLPLPYTEEALATICRNIDFAQEKLQQMMLIENPSSYIAFHSSTIPEWEFIAAIAARTGCAILLDVNNIYVSSVNHGFDPRAYISAIPAATIKEIHLAGHKRTPLSSTRDVLIDHHGAPVSDAVWDLYKFTLQHTGALPTLIEWDTDIPDFSMLQKEAEKANRLLQEVTTSSYLHVQPESKPEPVPA